MGRRNPWADRAQILLGYRDPGRIRDDRLRGFCVADGRSLPFPIRFAGRPYNSATLPRAL